jgi:hypothetical protein
VVAAAVAARRVLLRLLLRAQRRQLRGQRPAVQTVSERARALMESESAQQSAPVWQA